MVNSFKDLFGDSITEKIGTKFLDLDEEGEPSKCYRPSGQKGLWITAGTFYHARFFCKHLVRFRSHRLVYGSRSNIL